jgi:hypothetical protein
LSGSVPPAGFEPATHGLANCQGTKARWARWRNSRGER